MIDRTLKICLAASLALTGVGLILWGMAGTPAMVCPEGTVVLANVDGPVCVNGSKPTRAPR